MGPTGGGDNSGKMAKNCMKITKSAFFGSQQRGSHEEGGGYNPIFQVVGGGDKPHCVMIENISVTKCT